MSEHLVATLLVIASETQKPTTSSTAKLSKSPSKRSKAGPVPTTTTAAAPQSLLLKQLHPLMFAQPLSAFGGRLGGGRALPEMLQEEQLQQLQLGLLVQVSCLALHLKA